MRIRKILGIVGGMGSVAAAHTFQRMVHPFVSKIDDVGDPLSNVLHVRDGLLRVIVEEET